MIQLYRAVSVWKMEGILDVWEFDSGSYWKEGENYELLGRKLVRLIEQRENARHTSQSFKKLKKD